jgi:hypothetical protein
LCYLQISKVLFLLPDLCTCVSFISLPALPRASRARLKSSEQGTPLPYFYLLGNFWFSLFNMV